MNTKRGVGVVFAICVIVSGCQKPESEFDVRKRVVSEIIQTKIPALCLQAAHSDWAENGMDLSVSTRLQGFTEVCSLAGKLASQEKSEEIAAFGVAGVLALSDQSLMVMAKGYRCVATIESDIAKSLAMGLQVEDDHEGMKAGCWRG